MIYILIGAAILLFALWVTAPKINVVHAARAKSTSLVKQRRMPLTKIYHDVEGGRINMKNKFVGLVEGTSCVKYGIPDAATVLADRLHEDNNPTIISNGDLVIIDADAIKGASRNRFRKVTAVLGETVHFESDSQGELDPRPISEVFAKVTHVNSIAL